MPTNNTRSAAGIVGKLLDLFKAVPESQLSALAADLNDSVPVTGDQWNDGTRGLTKRETTGSDQWASGEGAAKMTRECR